MSVHSRKLRKWVDPATGDAGYSYWCQGCESAHMVRTESPSGARPRWTFNGNMDAPTFTPSVLVTYGAVPEADEDFKEWRVERHCHTFITNGMVQFLGDCYHKFAGQTLPLPDRPSDYGWSGCPEHPDPIGTP